MNNPLHDRALQLQWNGVPLPVYTKPSPHNKPLPGTKLLPGTRRYQQHRHPPHRDDDQHAVAILNPARLPHSRTKPPGSQAQADKPHPKAWQRAPTGNEYSSAEPDHPASKLSRINAKGEEWRSRIELWIEEVPVPDPKVMRAAMLKERSGLGEEVHRRKPKKTNRGLEFSFKGGLAAGTREDPVVIID